MRVVLFLGAGFSRAFDLPTMTEFFPAVAADPSFTSDQKALVQDVRQRARDAAAFISDSETNLEHALSFCLMNPGRDHRIRLGETESLQGAFCEILRKAYTGYGKTPESRLRDSVGGMLGLDRRSPREWKHSLTVVTTNYDIIAEFALSMLGAAPRLPFQPRWTNEKSVKLYDQQSTNSQICKLHGSVNFFQTEAQPIVVEGDVLIGQRFRNDNFENVAIPKVCSRDYTCPGLPLIVPPTFMKLKFDRELELSWQAAWTAIAEAEILAVIGYSFPRSDTYMRYFLANALTHNFSLNRILVVNPAAREIVSQLSSEDARLGRRFKELLHPVPQRWTDGFDMGLSH